MPTLSLGSSTLFNASPVETIQAAADSACDAVGVRLTGRSPDDGSASVAGNGPAIRELKRVGDDCGIPITHVTAYWVMPDLRLGEFLPIIDAAAELRAGQIVINCGYPEEGPFVSFMASYCEAAHKSGLRLLLEFMPYSGARTLEQAVRMLTAAGQPNFGLMIDPLHLARSGGTPAAVRGLAAGLVGMVQLCDAPFTKPAGVDLRTEALTDRLYPGEGELPLHELLDAIGPGVQIDIETPCRKHAGLAPADQARQAAAACRRFLATRPASQFGD